MTTKALNYEPENRQPFVDAIADIENREQPDWQEIWAGYEKWIDEQERGTVQ